MIADAAVLERRLGWRLSGQRVAVIERVVARSIGDYLGVCRTENVASEEKMES